MRHGRCAPRSGGPAAAGRRPPGPCLSLGFLSIALLLVAPASSSPAQIVADHAAVDAFERIPDDVLAQAARLRLHFRHASVGTTIDNALECLQGTRTSPTVCTTFPDHLYDRRLWAFEGRGNSGWYGKVDDFVEAVEGSVDGFDVFGFKYCYLDGLDGLQEPCGGPLDPAKVEAAWTYLRSHMEALEGAHPEKVFVWWTIPLTQVGQECTEVLNARIREHARAEGKVLFDIADIEAHDEAGTLRTNALGQEAAVKELCGEQKPDAQACHPNWAGSLRLAKSHWWLMARLAGWDGGSDPGEPDPVRFIRGDANADGARDVSDAVAVLEHLFRAGAPPACMAAADANDDGSVDVVDPVWLLGHLFGLGWTIAEPASECGPDPTEDGLGCIAFEPCR